MAIEGVGQTIFYVDQKGGRTIFYTNLKGDKPFYMNLKGNNDTNERYAKYWYLVNTN